MPILVRWQRLVLRSQFGVGVRNVSGQWAVGLGGVSGRWGLLSGDHPGGFRTGCATIREAPPKRLNFRFALHTYRPKRASFPTYLSVFITFSKSSPFFISTAGKSRTDTVPLYFLILKRMFVGKRRLRFVASRLLSFSSEIFQSPRRGGQRVRRGASPVPPAPQASSRRGPHPVTPESRSRRETLGS